MRGWRVSYHEITERRAEDIARALERFSTREGYYPESLDALTPRDVFFHPTADDIGGENGAMKAGENYYRLAAFYREFFSAPVSLRLYESAGDVPSGPMPCEERLAEMKEKYYSPMEDPNRQCGRPSPTAMPDIDVGIPKIEIKPLLNGTTALPGSWSPDGEYFVFATQENGPPFISSSAKPAIFVHPIGNSRSWNHYVSTTSGCRMAAFYTWTHLER
jgi:hypothetical protein